MSEERLNRELQAIAAALVEDPPEVPAWDRLAAIPLRRTTPSPLAGRRMVGSRRRRIAVTAIAAAALTMALVAVPMLVLGGRAGVTPSAPGSAESTGPDITTEIPPPAGEVSPAVAAYWALEGTLESVADEPGWLCPARTNEGYTAVVAEADIPPVLRFDLPGETPAETFNRYDGPVCHQPPILVLVDFDDGSRLSAQTAIAVWPQITRFEDTCPDDCSFVGGPIEEPVINGQPARLHLHTEVGTYNIWWTGSSGVPLYAEASGLSKEQLLDLIATIEIDPITHQATVSTKTPGDVEVLWNEPSVGVWEQGYWRATSYSTRQPGALITASNDASFNPYAVLARGVDQLRLVEIGDVFGVWIPEGGGYLQFEPSDGVLVRIEVEAAPDPVDAAALAGALIQHDKSRP